MIPYILVYWILGASAIGGGFVTGQATFNDEASCEAGLQKIKDAWSGRTPSGSLYGSVGGICSAATTPAPVAHVP